MSTPGFLRVFLSGCRVCLCYRLFTELKHKGKRKLDHATSRVSIGWLGMKAILICQEEDRTGLSLSGKGKQSTEAKVHNAWFYQYSFNVNGQHRPCTILINYCWDLSFQQNKSRLSYSSGELSEGVGEVIFILHRKPLVFILENIGLQKIIPEGWSWESFMQKSKWETLK